MANGPMYNPFVPIQGQPVQPGPNAFPFSPAFGRNPMAAAQQMPAMPQRPTTTNAPLGLLGQATPVQGTYGSLLDDIRNQAGRAGLAQTLMGLGRTTRRGEDRFLGAVQMGQQAQQQAYQQGLQNLMTRSQIEELDRPKGQQFRTLTPEEVRAAGFPEGSVIQQNTLTGQFDVTRAAPEAVSTLSTEQLKGLGLPEGTIAQQDGAGRVTILSKADPAKQFEVLTAEQKTALGLPLNVIAQREIGTGKVSAINGGDLNIGTIPAGMVLKRDKDGNPFLEPIEGSDVAKAAQAEERAKVQSLVSKGQNYDVVTSSINTALDIIKNEPTATGRLGALIGSSPDVIKAGTKRADLEAQITNVRGNIGFDRLQRMREESPTGGALGNVAVRELIDLQATLGSLDLNQSPPQLEENLQRIMDIYNTNIEIVATQYPEETLLQYGLGYLIPLKKSESGSETDGGATATSPAAGIPAGILEEEWNAMTDEERARFQ